VGDGGGRSFTRMCGASSRKDRTGRQHAVRPRLGFLLVGQLQKMTRRDDKLPSVLVLAQDGRTAPLRTLLPISSRTHDISLYLKMRLKRDLELDAMDEELEADVLRIIPEVGSGTYVFS